MKNIYFLIICISLSVGFTSIFGQNDTILIDFSNSTNLSDDPWNNFTDWNLDTEISGLKNTGNLTTNMSVIITDRFSGVNQNGTTSPEAALDIPSSASRESYFGNIEEWSGAIEPTAGFRFSGFNPTKEYTFILFASRMSVSDNRETKYKFTGEQADSTYLNPANNTSNITSISVMPASDGTIDLDMSPGENNTNPYHFYYLGALKIIYEEEDPLPPSLTIISPNGNEDWFADSQHNIQWTSVNITEDIAISYSKDNGATWIEIQSVPPTQNEISWTIPNVPSEECLVKLSSGDIEDLSDDKFIISDPINPAIKLIYPNGGEELIAGSVQMITWTPNKLTEDITTKFSTDNGSNWTTIGTVEPDSGSISWTVPDIVSNESYVLVQSGIYADTSSRHFSITESICSNTIVVLGSSTAAGTGPSSLDSAWVWRYSAALEAIDPEYLVVNLGLGGYNTFQILPTGTILEPGITESIDVNRNVTKALSYSPYAIIVNMPSNDAKLYSAEQTLENLKIVYDYANANGVKTWIATTQPRNFTEPAQLEIQKYLSQAIPERYPDHYIDFWTGFADENNHIISQYDSGDGVHMNDAGHRILFERVLEKQLHLKACSSSNIKALLANPYEIYVFPNPAGDEFTLSYTTNSKAKIDIRLFDVSGKELANAMVYENESGSHQLSFPCAQFSGTSSIIIGVIKIDDDQGITTSKVRIIVI